jgi:O-antigen ligase
LVGLLAAQLVLLPWALGGMFLWSRIPSLLLSLAALVVALLPRHITVDASSPQPITPNPKAGSSKQKASSYELVAGSPEVGIGSPELIANSSKLKASSMSYTAYTYPKLLHWPVFWLGLVFFAYVGIQMFNPAWSWAHNAAGGWWMKQIPSIEWLPSGVTGVPARLCPPWMAALPFLSGFLSACAAWTGLTRRRAITLLLTILVVNGALLSAFAMLDKLAGNGLMYGFITPVNDFVGPFMMRNHGGAYFNLMLGLACSLGAYHYIRTQRLMLKSTPGGVFVFFALMAGITVIASQSRGAIIAMLIFSSVLLIVFVIRRIFGETQHTNPIISVSLTALLLCFIVIGAKGLNASGAWQRFQVLVESGRGSVDYEQREAATDATLDMAQDKLGLGHGFGCYRYLFTSYQLKYPIIGVDNGRITAWWQHAHNDYAEALAELGIVGLLPLLGIFIYFALQFVKNYFWRHSPIWIGLGALLMVAGHARFDFPAHLPSLAVTWCVTLPLLLRWCEVEEK